MRESDESTEKGREKVGGLCGREGYYDVKGHSSDSSLVVVLGGKKNFET